MWRWWLRLYINGLVLYNYWLPKKLISSIKLICPTFDQSWMQLDKCVRGYSILNCVNTPVYVIYFSERVSLLALESFHLFHRLLLCELVPIVKWALPAVIIKKAHLWFSFKRLWAFIPHGGGHVCVLVLKCIQYKKTYLWCKFRCISQM